MLLDLKMSKKLICRKTPALATELPSLTAEHGSNDEQPGHEKQAQGSRFGNACGGGEAARNTE